VVAINPLLGCSANKRYCREEAVDNHDRLHLVLVCRSANEFGELLVIHRNQALCLRALGFREDAEKEPGMGLSGSDGCLICYGVTIPICVII